MSFFAPKVTGNTRDEYVTEAQRQRHLKTIKKDKRSYFDNCETCSQISLCRMPNPKGKIYRG